MITRKQLDDAMQICEANSSRLEANSETDGESRISSKRPSSSSRSSCSRSLYPAAKRVRSESEITSFSPYVWYQNSLPSIPTQRTVRTLSLRDLFEFGLHEEKITQVVLTSFMVEIEYLLRNIPMLCDVPTILIHDHNGLMPPPISTFKIHRAIGVLPYGCAHGKMMLIYSEKVLRVVVTTANLCQGDWERKIQGVWFQDFPLLLPKESAEKKHETSSLTIENNSQDFVSTLCDYFRRIGYFDVDRDVAPYDFSSAAVVLVTSVPGTHKDENLEKYGHMKIRKSLENEFVLRNEDNVGNDNDDGDNRRLVIQSSSLGSLSEKWLKELQSSFHVNTSISPRIVWPSLDFVRGSIDGYEGGGSLCCRARHIKNEFVQKCLRSWNPSRRYATRYPPHIKSYVAIRSSLISSTRISPSSAVEIVDRSIAWMLLTSANCSRAAWGSLQKNNSQLFVRSYEAGVLFLPSLHSGKKRYSFAASFRSKIDDEHGVIKFPIPYSLPLEKISEPWVWDQKHNKPDSFGQHWDS